MSDRIASRCSVTEPLGTFPVSDYLALTGGPSGDTGAGKGVQAALGAPPGGEVTPCASARWMCGSLSPGVPRGAVPVSSLAPRPADEVGSSDGSTSETGGRAFSESSLGSKL